MKLCRSCGVPRIISFFVRWNDNGTITQLFGPEFRIVIMRADLVGALLANVGEALGLSIEHIAFEAQRNAARAVFDTYFHKMKVMRLVLGIDRVKRLQLEQFSRVAMLSGHCRSDTIEYVPGRYGLTRIRNPFNKVLVAANVAGAMEAMEGAPFRHLWEDEVDGSCLLRVDREDEKPDLSDRMILEFPALLPGERRPERCVKCRAPSWISRLQWREDEGVIAGRRHGRRVVILDGHMVTAVFRELTRELGEEGEEVLVGAQSRWVNVHARELGLTTGGVTPAEEEREGIYRRFLDTFPLLGHGNPVSVEAGGGRLSARIDNPYERLVLAGTLLGAFEAVEGVKGRVEQREPVKGSILYSVTPA